MERSGKLPEANLPVLLRIGYPLPGGFYLFGQVLSASRNFKPRYGLSKLLGLLAAQFSFCVSLCHAFHLPTFWPRQ